MNKNKGLLQSFVAYCDEHPEQRFWQALRNWSGVSFVQVIRVANDSAVDTFYFEGRDG